MKPEETSEIGEVVGFDRADRTLTLQFAVMPAATIGERWVARPQTATRPAAIEEDTPETQAALHGVWYGGDHGSTIPALCRKLERERDALKKRLKQLELEV